MAITVTKGAWRERERKGRASENYEVEGMPGKLQEEASKLTSWEPLRVISGLP